MFCNIISPLLVFVTIGHINGEKDDDDICHRESTLLSIDEFNLLQPESATVNQEGDLTLWFGSGLVRDGIHGCVEEFEVLIKEEVQGDDRKKSEFEIRQNLTVYGSTLTGLLNATVSYSEVAAAANLNKFPPPLSVKAAVRAFPKKRDGNMRGFSRPNFLAVSVGVCREGKVGFFGVSMPTTELLNFDTEDNTATVLFGWNEPSCKKAPIGNFFLLIQGEGKNIKMTPIPIKDGTLKKELVLGLGERYSIQILATNLKTGEKISSQVRWYSPENCDEARFRKEVSFNQLEWNGVNEMATVRVSVSELKESDCLMGLAVAHWNKDSESETATMIDLGQVVETFNGELRGKPMQHYADIAVAPGAETKFQLLALVNVGEENQLDVVFSGYAKEFKATEGGGCFRGRAGPEINGRPTLDVVKGKRGGYNLTVSWDEDLMTGDLSCLDHLIAKAWVEEKYGRKVMMESGFGSWVEMTADREVDEKATSAVMEVEWSDLQEGQVVKAVVGAKDFGEDLRLRESQEASFLV